MHGFGRGDSSEVEHMKTTTLKVRVYDPSGRPATGASVSASLVSVGVSADGYIGRSAINATADSDGLAEIDLWPSAQGATDAEYRIVARGADGRKLVDERVSVPESEAPVWLQDIVMVPAPTPKPYDKESIDAIRDNRILAQDARVGSEGARDESQNILHQVQSEGSTINQSLDGIAQAVTDSEGYASDAEQHKIKARDFKDQSLQGRQDAEQALTQTTGALQDARAARDQALAIYGDTQAQQQAVSDAQGAAQTATEKASSADGSAGRALQSENEAAAKASEAATARGKANSQADQAKNAASAAASDLSKTNNALQEARTASGKAVSAKQDAQSLAQQVNIDAGATLSRSSDLIAHANSTLSEVSANRRFAETASQEAVDALEQALSIYGSVQEVSDAVTETYFNRAAINIQISTNMIMLRA